MFFANIFSQSVAAFHYLNCALREKFLILLILNWGCGSSDRAFAYHA
jgi:hypothetical protein